MFKKIEVTIAVGVLFLSLYGVVMRWQELIGKLSLIILLFGAATVLYYVFRVFRSN